MGFLVHKYSSDMEGYDTSGTGFAVVGGLGDGLPRASISGWVEGRFTQGRFSDGNTGFLAVMAGISKRVGGRV